jgi:hypothetical protein
MQWCCCIRQPENAVQAQQALLHMLQRSPHLVPLQTSQSSQAQLRETCMYYVMLPVSLLIWVSPGGWCSCTAAMPPAACSPSIKLATLTKPSLAPRTNARSLQQHASVNLDNSVQLLRAGWCSSYAVCCSLHFSCTERAPHCLTAAGAAAGLLITSEL